MITAAFAWIVWRWTSRAASESRGQHVTVRRGKLQRDGKGELRVKFGVVALIHHMDYYMWCTLCPSAHEKQSYICFAVISFTVLVFIFVVICLPLLRFSSTRRRFYPQRSSGQAVVTGVAPSPPQYVPWFLSRIGFSIPTARRFSSNVANSRSRAFRWSIITKEKVPKSMCTRWELNSRN